MTGIVESPPDPDEMEVTLLGRGVGESCVIHLGDHRWMIVDSFKVDGQPAALSYLDDIGVSHDLVEHVVVTHFHTDHYRGVDQIHDDCPNAMLHVTEALETDEFRKLHVHEEEPSFLESMPAVILRAKNRRLVSGASTVPGFNSLKLGASILDEGGVRVVAISPSRDAIASSVESLAAALTSRDSAVVTASLKDENRSSVAIHIDGTNAFGCSVLLGADLVAKPRRLGWDAVINDRALNLSMTQLTKVAHHGSKHNHHQPAWDALTEAGSVLLVAPYWSSGIPKKRDLARLQAHGETHVAAPPAKWQDVDGHRRPVDIKVGVIQARRRMGEPSWRVTHREPAYPVT